MRSRPEVGASPAVRLLAGAIVLLTVALLGAAAWWLSGGRWLTIDSPSMGEAAPVGTLVLTRPVVVADLAPGDLVSFVPPTLSTTYTHRVAEVLADGGVRTQGDINRQPDSWTLHANDLTGVVVARWWGVGWVLRALPLLTLLLGVVLAATARFVNHYWRKPMRLFLVPVCFAVVGLIYRPWVGMMLVDQRATENGELGRLVSTGVLPMKAFVADAGAAGLDQALHLIAGQVGELPLIDADDRGRVLVNGTIDLHGWWLVTVVGICLLPILYALVTLRQDRTDDAGDDVEGGEFAAAALA